MKTTVSTYRKDPLYPKIVKATAEILKETDEISPVMILMTMGNLTKKDYDAWRRGEVRYLERVFQGSLSKANRILRIIGFHAHDLNMFPSQNTYRRYNKKSILRFSKSGELKIEERYSKHFRWNQSSLKKTKLIEQTLSEQRNPSN